MNRQERDKRINGVELDLIEINEELSELKGKLDNCLVSGQGSSEIVEKMDSLRREVELKKKEIAALKKLEPEIKKQENLSRIAPLVPKVNDVSKKHNDLIKKIVEAVKEIGEYTTEFNRLYQEFHDLSSEIRYYAMECGEKAPSYSGIIDFTDGERNLINETLHASKCQLTHYRNMANPPGRYEGHIRQL